MATELRQLINYTVLVISALFHWSHHFLQFADLRVFLGYVLAFLTLKLNNSKKQSL